VLFVLIAAIALYPFCKSSLSFSQKLADILRRLHLRQVVGAPSGGNERNSPLE
jgi:hypothetical protein